MGRRRIKLWYWALLAVWAVVLAAALTYFQDWRALVYVLMVFVTSKPLIGLPALLALVAPLIALPFAVRRPKFLPE